MKELSAAVLRANAAQEFCSLTRIFGKGLPDPELPTAEDEFVDAEADLGREAEERRGGGVAVHDFVLSGGGGRYR